MTVDLNKIMGLLGVAWWFDPRTGATSRNAGEFAVTGPTVLTPPTSDWLVLIDDETRNFAPPSAQR